MKTIKIKVLKEGQESLVETQVKRTFEMFGETFGIHRKYYGWLNNNRGGFYTKGWECSHINTGSCLDLRRTRGDTPTTIREAELMGKEKLAVRGESTIKQAVALLQKITEDKPA